jgi:tetratricopeptide (TPR) repeat protein
MTRRLGLGRTAIDKGDFASAIEILSALEREQADFGDVAALLTRAKGGVRAGTQQRAQATFDEAQQKERQQDFVGAIQGYQQAEKIDPDLAPRVAAAITAARARQKTLVDDLFKQANTDFAFRRPAAIPAYQRILRLLADDDPRRTEAQTKLNQLTGAKQPGVDPR